MLLPHDPFVPTPDSPEWVDPSRRYENDTIYFDDMITFTDKLVGEIEEKLKENGLWENTLFIFTADNGTHPSIFSNTKTGIFKGGKGSTLVSGNHVPLIISWPKKIKKNSVFQGLIDFSDILPTLSYAAGVDPNSYFSDGQSFNTVLEGNHKKKDKNEVFIHYTPRWGPFKHSRWIMDSHYKLYHNENFYDLKNDPMEENPLFNLTKNEENINEHFKNLLLEKEKEFPFSNNDEEFKP
jgi:arylsulfatase A